jgi:tetratricopeptide (TPR) repeat protein
VAALGWFWVLLDNHGQAAALLGEALGMPPERLRQAPADAVAVAYGYLALHSGVAGNLAGAMEAFEAAVRVGRDLDRTASHPMVGLLRPIIDAYLRYLDGGQAAIGQGLGSELDHPDPWIRAAVRLAHGIFAANLGADQGTAEHDLAAALESFEAVGDRWGMSMVASGLAEALSLRGDHQGAVAARERALRLFEELMVTGEEVVEAQVRLGVERARAGDLAGGREGLRRALREAERHGSVRLRAFVLGGLAELALRAGDLAEARRGYQLALSVLEEVTESKLAMSTIQVHFLIGLGHVAAASGEVAEAEARYREAFTLCAGVTDLPLLAETIDGLAGAAFGRGEVEVAATLLGAAVAVRGTPNLGQPEVAALMARVEERLGAAAYRRAYDHGASMTREAALAYADRWPAAQARRR